MTRAPAGVGVEREGPAATIRLPRMTTVWLGTGVESRPSITVTPVNASGVCALADAAGDASMRLPVIAAVMHARVAAPMRRWLL